MTNKYDRKNIGKIGEDMAAIMLEEKGYTILKRNYRCIYGEIDIIAAKNKVLSFVEVKTRLNDKYGLGRESVGKRKQRKIKNCANLFLNEDQRGFAIYDDQYHEIEFQVVDIFVEHIEKLAF